MEVRAMPHAKKLAINRIRVDGDTQPRERIDEGTVAEYAEEMAAGAVFPAAQVFSDGSDYWLSDGFHRLMAARRAGRADLLCEIIQGTQQDAQLSAVATNQTHGMRRTNGDKLRAVVRTLRHPTVVAGKWTTGKIAMHCGVSVGFVSDTRKSLGGQSAHPEHTGRPRKPSESDFHGENRHAEAPANTGDFTPPQDVVAGVLIDSRGMWVNRAPVPPPQDVVAGVLIDSPMTTAEGQAVPVRLRAAFAQRPQIMGMMALLSDVKLKVFAALDKRDPVFADINGSAFQAAIENARRELSATVPHALCPYCAAKGCKTCHDRGYVGKYIWANAPGDLRSRARK
jgi:hypothetical protein